MKRFIAFVFLSFNSLSECKTQSLTGTKWELIEVLDETEVNGLRDTAFKMTLLFTTDSTYQGYFCNSYFGKYTSDQQSSLTLDRPSASRKYCSGRYSEQEGKLISYYQQVNSYAMSGGKLYLYAVRLKMVFKRS